MSTTDLKAYRKWSKVPKDQQQLIINNVFCGKCFATRIVDYTVQTDDHGVLLKGKCDKCGKDVARLVEDL